MSGNKAAPTIAMKVFLPGKDAKRVEVTQRITNFEFEDTEGSADKCEFDLDNYDLAMFDDPLWAKGNMIEVSWGYVGQMTEPQECVIQSVKGFQPMKVIALAKSILMNKIVKSRLFDGPIKRSDIVRTIAKENGYNDDEIDIDDTVVKFPHVSQAKLTDAQFLMQMAQREKFQFYVDGSGFHFVRRKMNKPPVMELEYFTDPGRGDIISISVENDVTAKPGSVSAKGRDPLAKKDINVTSHDGNTARTVVADTIEIVDAKTATTSLQVKNVAAEHTGQTSAPNADAAKRETAGAFIATQQTAVLLTIEARGNPRLKAKNIIVVKNISKRLSGRYYVKNLKHKVGSDYLMTIGCRSDGGGSGAGSSKVKTKDGDQNTKASTDETQLVPVEVVDPITKKTHVEYRKAEK